jgi:hypothetical protein
MSTVNQPYISIVITGRNDNYGGDFDQRLQTTINWYCYYFEAQKVDSEIILVNYNPVAENKELKDKIAFPVDRKYVTIRIITVPSSVHQQYHDPVRKELPFYEFPAKNVGIRRAKGEFILSTNADVILPFSIINYIARRKLKKGIFYRAGRVDYKKFDLTGFNPRKFLRLCRKGAFMYHEKGFKYKIENPFPFWLNFVFIKCINFIKVQWEMFKVKHQETLIHLKMHYNPHNVEFKYHLNNSGDFMLMNREHWFDLKGNPEKTFISTHTDALFVVMAGVSGLKEYIFFAPVFHQEHERRFSWVDLENDSSIRKVYLAFQDKAQTMMRSGQVIIDNEESWGGAGFTLPEEII